jgi:exosortase/archaeosortase family protein
VIDYICAGSGCALALLPWGVAGWIGAAGLALRLVSAAEAGSYARRGAWIMLSVTVPLVWSKMLFSIFAPYILAIDASLVSTMLQTARDGNLVAIPGGTGSMQIAAACSSLANTSLVIPLWTTMTQVAGLSFRLSRLKWPLAAGLAAIAINIVRISLIGWFPSKYDLIHGEYGQLVVSIIIMVTIFLVCKKGLENETIARSGM